MQFNMLIVVEFKISCVLALGLVHGFFADILLKPLFGLFYASTCSLNPEVCFLPMRFGWHPLPFPCVALNRRRHRFCVLARVSSLLRCRALPGPSHMNLHSGTHWNPLSFFSSKRMQFS